MMADGQQIEGVDYTGGADIGALVSAGKVFACRYGGPGGDWKHLTPAEAQALSAAGIAVVANAEGSESGLLGGWSSGYSWAASAEEHFRRCGMPPGRPIYFSVDFDVQSGQWAAVASALSGAAQVLGGVHRVGVYGGRRAMEWARRDGVASWFWQTYAWSSGVWVPGNHLEQYRNSVILAGINLDLDRALATDFGQWTTTGDDMTPEQNRLLKNAETYSWKESAGEDPITGILDNNGNLIKPGMPNVPMRTAKAALDASERALAAVTELAGRPPVVAAPTDPAALKAVLLDPEVLSAIAVAVADEDHRRSAT